MKWYSFSRCRNTLAKYFEEICRIALFPATVTRIPFNGIDPTFFNPRNNPNMVGSAILTAAFFVHPIEENQHSGRWCDAPVYPLTMLLEPGYAPFTAGKLRNDASIDISALVGAPADEAGAPLYPFGIAIPTPIRFSPRHFQFEKQQLLQ